MGFLALLAGHGIGDYCGDDGGAAAQETRATIHRHGDVQSIARAGAGH